MNDKKQKLRAALFDMDGTLLDSMGMWAQVPHEILGRYGVTPGEDVIREMAPLTIAQCAEVMVARFGLATTPAALTQEVLDHIRDQYDRHLPLKAGAAAVVERLNAMQVPVSLASASRLQEIHAAMDRLGMTPRFAAVLSSEEHGSKHEPRIYLEGARRMGAAPEQTAVFEDTLAALRTAHAAGFFTVMVEDEASRPDWEEMAALADLRLARWEDFDPAEWFA
ncbi:MAG: HAD family phosphatase [Oscillospiraceae bacterium]|nr:HAD family phosphatase [Oscillospiraceae bacterium]